MIPASTIEQLHRQRDALIFLHGFIHGYANHKGDARTCTKPGCAEARAGLAETVNVNPGPDGRISVTVEPKPDLVQPGQIWRNNANPTFRIKIEQIDPPYAAGEPVDPSGNLVPGKRSHVRMDGPRTIAGYTRDHEAERAELERQQ